MEVRREVQELETDYAAMLDQLRQGEIDEIEITPETFMAFHDVYLAADDRKKIIGKAQAGGIVKYIYDNDEK